MSIIGFVPNMAAALCKKKQRGGGGGGGEKGRTAICGRMGGKVKEIPTHALTVSKTTKMKQRSYKLHYCLEILMEIQNLYSLLD